MNSRSWRSFFRPLARFLPLLGLTAAIGLACEAELRQGQAPPEKPKSAAAVPATLRAAYLDARQKDAGVEHAFRQQSAQSATLIARNPVQGLEATLDDQGLRLRNSQRAELPATSLSLQRYGCAASLRAADPTPPRAQALANRVEYARDGIREWYLNGPLGLEHGFTLDQDLGCGQNDKLALVMSLGGKLDATLAGQGAATHLELRDPKTPKAAPVLLYSDLFALDADGKELPSRMLLVERTLRLEVDTAGARYPVTVDPMWTQQAILTSSDGLANDQFGIAVAVNGDTAVVGAFFKTVSGNVKQGQAYVYVRSGTMWSEQAKLTASDGTANDRFGEVVAVSGDTAVVGAYNKTVGGNVSQGEAYVYVRSGTTWTEQARLTSSDGTANNSFGNSIALDMDTVVVGSYVKDVGTNSNQGEAYIYFRSGTTWSEQAKLFASDAAANDLFGDGVAVSGDTVIVTSYGKDIGGNSKQGQAYVYVRSGTTWSEEAKIRSSDGAAFDRFGNAVALEGNTAVIGAYNKTVGGNASQGKAYVYVRSGTLWSEQAKLVASDGMAGDQFGYVSLSGNTAVIGAPFKMIGGSASQGEAYVYVRSGTTWSEQTKLTASDGAANDQFGMSVGVSGGTTIIGANNKTVSGNAGQGQAYVYVRDLGASCATGTDCASTYCVDGVCCDLPCGGGVTTDCQSCLAAQTGLAMDGTCGTITSMASYVCRALAGSCDVAEKCDGTNPTCPTDSFLPSTTVCRGAAGTCDVAENCTGSGAACPTDVLLPATTICRAAAGVCDVAEKCTGTTVDCPPDVMKAAMTICRPSGGPCDLAESCDGTKPSCPTDAVKSAGTLCKLAGSQSPICDPADFCDGTRKLCPAIYAPAGTSCGTSKSCNSLGNCL